MKIAIYVILVVVAVISIILGFYSQEQIKKIEDKEKQEKVRNKWNLVFVLIGVALVIIIGALMIVLFK